MENKPLIIYDGYCNLCNRFIRLARAADKKKRFRMISSGHISKELNLSDLPDTDSVFYIENGIIYTNSEALLKIAQKLPLPWKLACILRVIPKKIRDAAYHWIARNRYKWFGRKKTCNIPKKS